VKPELPLSALQQCGIFQPIRASNGPILSVDLGLTPFVRLANVLTVLTDIPLFITRMLPYKT